jgi:branched-chain amino acid aminotransferase
MDLVIEKEKDTRLERIDYNNLGFGRYFSDNVYISEFKNGKWSDGEVIPYGDLACEPAMCTLHYGQSIFEGLKAYKDFKNGGVNIFRPDMNAKRFNNSAYRMCIEEFPEEQFIDAVCQIVQKDVAFLPHEKGQSLYIRPVCYGDSNFLGVHSSPTFKFIIMTSPVASYYESGLAPVKILVPSEFARTVEGGLGMAKTAANYAASLYAGRMAKQQGFQQVLWLDGKHNKYIDEVGAMNIFFVIDGVLVTPPLDSGTILPGVTRNTVIQLAKELDIPVKEERISIDDVWEAHKNGILNESFGTGTAATISPVGLLHYKGESITINNNEIGTISKVMYDTITGIQHGLLEDTNNWNVHLNI